MNTEYTKISGGLDLVTPVLSLSPGKVTVSYNYEPGDNGGMKRIDGCERFDGQAAPSDAVYYHCDVSLTATVSTGDILTGAASGAYGTVIVAEDAALMITRVAGTYTADENLTVGGVPVGALSGPPILKGCAESYDNAVAMNLAADEYRGDIAKPTGSGPIRGGGKLAGVVYVFRDNLNATAMNLWKATTSGWEQVTFQRNFLLYRSWHHRGRGYGLAVGFRCLGGSETSGT
jgi:hypothetical protein